jgi:hypothetical protein
MIRPDQVGRSTNKMAAAAGKFNPCLMNWETADYRTSDAGLVISAKAGIQLYIQALKLT